MSEPEPGTYVDEVIATYEDGAMVYEIDHLGIAYPSQWGEFAVYLCGTNEQVAEFAIPESALKPEFRPADLPVTTGELIELAKAAVRED